MKKVYTLLAVLVAVCTALPSAAQNHVKNKVTRAVVRAEKAHKHQQKQAVCAACGEKITAPYQHCKATGYTGICAPKTAASEKAGTEKGTPDVCPGCGQAYTIDEKYHGVKHVCPAQEKAEVCASCGNPITQLSQRCPSDPDVHCLPAPKSDAKAHTCYRCGKSFQEGQHCSAAHGNALCANSPEQERRLEQAEKERSAAAEKARHCPKCGEAYSVDELYHGEKHVCPAAKTANGPTGGEPQGPMYQEVDEGALYRAEELLQADRDANNGKPKHNLEYYYKQVTSAKK